MEVMMAERVCLAFSKMASNRDKVVGTVVDSVAVPMGFGVGMRLMCSGSACGMEGLGG